MPRPSQRLDILITPQDVEWQIDWAGVESLLDSWEDAGATDGDGPGPNADSLIKGGFDRIWLERAGKVRLFGNHQGGYYTSCPVTGDNVAAAFQRALLEWRTGGERALVCPACSETHAFEALLHRPQIAFATGAVVLANVQTAIPEPMLIDALAAPLGGVRVVHRRVG